MGQKPMDDSEIARFWDDNAEAWTMLSRAGYDEYRDGLNTPAFLAMLPDVRGRVGLDVGCGEGHNTRLLAARGADMTAIDVSRVFLRHAVAAERLQPHAIHYVHASAGHVPCADGTFDFVTAFMSLMDMPGLERVLAEIHRVLRPGGFLQASIEHPCFATPYRRNLRDANRRTYALEVGDYFRRLDGTLAEWTFSAAPAEVRDSVLPFRIPRFNRPLGQWINLLIDSGFVIERLEEPRPDDEAVRAYPKLQCAQVVAYFLHMRVRKI
jgi:ubiquinone/menaquinone biosynthesis C-methylase UbiE